MRMNQPNTPQTFVKTGTGADRRRRLWEKWFALGLPLPVKGSTGLLKKALDHRKALRK